MTATALHPNVIIILANDPHEQNDLDQWFEQVKAERRTMLDNDQRLG